MILDIIFFNSDLCYNVWFVDFFEILYFVLDENVFNICSIYCIILVVEFKFKKISIFENVILGDIRDMINDDDVVFKEVVDIIVK